MSFMKEAESSGKYTWRSRTVIFSWDPILKRIFTGHWAAPFIITSKKWQKWPHIPNFFLCCQVDTANPIQTSKFKYHFHIENFNISFTTLMFPVSGRHMYTNLSILSTSLHGYLMNISNLTKPKIVFYSSFLTSMYPIPSLSYHLFK